MINLREVQHKPSYETMLRLLNPDSQAYLIPHLRSFTPLPASELLLKAMVNPHFLHYPEIWTLPPSERADALESLATETRTPLSNHELTEAENQIFTHVLQTCTRQLKATHFSDIDVAAAQKISFDRLSAKNKKTVKEKLHQRCSRPWSEVVMDALYDNRVVNTAEERELFQTLWKWSQRAPSELLLALVSPSLTPETTTLIEQILEDARVRQMLELLLLQYQDKTENKCFHDCLDYGSQPTETELKLLLIAQCYLQPSLYAYEPFERQKLSLPDILEMVQTRTFSAQ